MAGSSGAGAAAERRASSDSGIRKKKMRKGTHSCFECRRRKIRCIFAPDNPAECTECYARGSKCVDQEKADGDIVDQRKNLRVRVARLESVIETLLDDKMYTRAAEVLAGLGANLPTPRESDGASPESACQAAAELLEGLDGRVTCGTGVQPCPQSAQTEALSSNTPLIPYSGSGLEESNLQVSNSTIDDEDDGDSIPRKQANSKDEHARRTLLAAFPPQETLQALLVANERWWVAWRNRILADTEFGSMSLEEFASHALRHNNPCEIGMLLLCVGAAQEVDELKNCLNLVQSLIISDDDFSATVEGMRCTILLMKCYTEIGQPRRAWLATRRALTFAQLTGLHRNHRTSPALNSLWWGLYQGDRFLSLLLGLPYGISDIHCDLSAPIPSPTASLAEQTGHFCIKVSILAGQVIDRTQGVCELSFASALEIDTRLDALAASMPYEFWHPCSTNSPAPHNNVKLASLRDCLLAQLIFYQLRVYLHLPFMLKSATDAKLSYSRTSCFASSRELLRAYQHLRSVNGTPLYECKVIDFLGFTAAVIIMLGLLGYGRSAPSPSSYPNSNSSTASALPPPSEEDESDWALVSSAMTIFQRAADEKGGKVAAQSARVLGQLRSLRHREPAGPDTPDDKAQSYRIAIPYFGTISVRRGARVSGFGGESGNGKDDRGGRLGYNAATLPQSQNRSSQTPSSNGTTPRLQTQAWPESQPQPAPQQHHHHQQQQSLSPGASSYAAPFLNANLGLGTRIAYDGLYMHGGLGDSAGFGLEGAEGAMGAMNWQLPAGMDIDQDWGWCQL